MGLLSRIGSLIGAGMPRASASIGTPLVGPIHDSAGGGPRTRAWYAPTIGPNAAQAFSGETLRNRARREVRSNPWASSALDALVSNIVGTGITPHPLFPDERVRAAIKALWLRSTDESDADGVTDFYGQTALAVRGMIEGGECFGRLRPRLASDGLAVPLQLQLLEAEHAPLWKTESLATGGEIRNGVEFDAIGRKVAVWMTRQHPGEFGGQAPGSTLVRIPAEHLLHLFRPLRPGQGRGEPWFARTLLRLWTLDKYEDAEAVRKNVVANHTGVVIKPYQDGGPSVGTTEEEGEGEANLSSEPGSISFLAEGEDIKWNTPTDDGAALGIFAVHQLRAIAAGLGITYEALTGDMTQVNYSSARVALLEFRRRCEAWIHQVVVFQFCRPYWRAWLDAAVLSGALADVIAPRDYRRTRAAYLDVRWDPQGWQWVDPAKEVSAAVDSVRAGFTTRTAVCAGLGEDAEKIDAQNAVDNQRADAAGLQYDSDGRQAKTGAVPAPADAMDPKPGDRGTARAA